MMPESHRSGDRRRRIDDSIDPLHLQGFVSMVFVLACRVVGIGIRGRCIYRGTPTKESLREKEKSKWPAINLTILTSKHTHVTKMLLLDVTKRRMGKADGEGRSSSRMSTRRRAHKTAGPRDTRSMWAGTSYVTFRHIMITAHCFYLLKVYYATHTVLDLYNKM